MPCGPVLRANRADIAVRQSLVLIRARPLCPGGRPRRRIRVCNKPKTDLQEGVNKMAGTKTGVYPVFENKFQNRQVRPKFGRG